MHGKKLRWKPRVPFANMDGRLYRHIDIKLIIGNDVKKKRHTAAPGKGYTLENIREACDAMIETLEKAFPDVEFREVQVLPNAYNYIACEPKPKPLMIPPRPDLQLAGEIFVTVKRPILNEEVKDGTTEGIADAGDRETSVLTVGSPDWDTDDVPNVGNSSLSSVRQIVPPVRRDS